MIPNSYIKSTLTEIKNVDNIIKSSYLKEVLNEIKMVKKIEARFLVNPGNNQDIIVDFKVGEDKISGATYNIRKKVVEIWFFDVETLKRFHDFLKSRGIPFEQVGNECEISYKYFVFKGYRDELIQIDEVKMVPTINGEWASKTFADVQELFRKDRDIKVSLVNVLTDDKKNINKAIEIKLSKSYFQYIAFRIENLEGVDTVLSKKFLIQGYSKDINKWHHFFNFANINDLLRYLLKVIKAAQTGTGMQNDIDEIKNIGSRLKINEIGDLEISDLSIEIYTSVWKADYLWFTTTNDSEDIVKEYLESRKIPYIEEYLNNFYIKKIYFDHPERAITNG